MPDQDDVAPPVDVTVRRRYTSVLDQKTGACIDVRRIGASDYALEYASVTQMLSHDVRDLLSRAEAIAYRREEDATLTAQLLVVAVSRYLQAVEQTAEENVPLIKEALLQAERTRRANKPSEETNRG